MQRASHAAEKQLSGEDGGDEGFSTGFAARFKPMGRGDSRSGMKSGTNYSDGGVTNYCAHQCQSLCRASIP